MKVYKYRSVEEKIFKRDFDTISDKFFYSSNYSTLNDPFDIYFSEQISPLIKFLNILFPNNDSSNFEKQLKLVLGSKEKTGIYCLSKNFLNEQLWAYYASAYSGYCIEYDLEILVDKSQNSDFEYMLEIDYNDIIPTIDINDIKNPESLIRKMYAIKKANWKHEDEIRLIFNNYGFKKFHPSAITGIYFGYKTDKIVKESFYNLFENEDVKFYEIFPSNFKLDYKLIYETKRKLKYDISKFDFEILRSRTNQWEHVYEIFYKGNYEDIIELKEFILAFREKYCIKTSTLILFNNKRVMDLIESNSLTDEEYVRYADSIITAIYGDEVVITNPFKDLKYNEILNKR
ncbi:DUF2971 domain-containing protein [Chryseobacterium defluvii]|uniref:DUF2971 family protein n=1 Tax=Chryseobacterium defluvii TaxID=160396 RepID=A0A495S9U2_9FLAO|nr:DUF2971 domain-containing protein [Chryseobacterium defluvii]RKS96602.1 Protein of unknown function (DUF2971) [Chryseobacterium defluvii]